MLPWRHNDRCYCLADIMNYFCCLAGLLNYILIIVGAISFMTLFIEQELAQKINIDYVVDEFYVSKPCREQL